MSGGNTEVPSVFHEVRNQLNERFMTLVVDGYIKGTRHESRGFEDRWSITTCDDAVTEIVLNSPSEAIAFLSGFYARDAFVKGLAEYEDISDRLSGLVYRGILSSKTAHGYLAGDWTVYRDGKRIALADKQEALDLLAQYE